MNDHWVGHITREDADARFALVREMLHNTAKIAFDNAKRAYRQSRDERYTRFLYAGLIVKAIHHALSHDWDQYTGALQSLKDEIKKRPYFTTPPIVARHDDREWRTFVSYFNACHKGYFDLIADTRHEYVGDPVEYIILFTFDPFQMLLQYDYGSFVRRLEKTFKICDDLFHSKGV